jgi:hypothetical protein
MVAIIAPLTVNLFTDAQFRYDRLIPLDILGLQIVQKTSPLAYQFEKPSSGMMILLVDLEMFREIRNTLSQQSHLHFR